MQTFRATWKSASCFGPGRDPHETVRELKSWGVRCGQMGIPGDMPLEGAAAPWKQALAR